jgi:hypothetical protein
MPDETASKSPIPILTDVVEATPPSHESAQQHEIDTLIAELQTELSASAFSLTEQVLRTAMAEMEATLYEQITARLRQELPELIDRVLRERLTEDEDP